jgi:hypothetical protein
MSEVQPQLFITTVHGTWGRGFFPRRQRQNRRLWFEEESPLLDRLIEKLGDIPHKITPLLWSGANSTFARDKTAHVLAEHLSDEHAEHPQATQLVIAHSHGGNIALRALYLLRKRDASRLCGPEMPTPLVVTLATPFVEVQRADLDKRPSVIRFLVLYAMGYLLVLPALLYIWGFPPLDESGTTLLIAVLLAFPVAISGFWWWDVRRAPVRQHQIDALNDATRLDEVVSAQAQRLLIIRAIDDEASLTLALGTIVGYAITGIIGTIGTIIIFIITHVHSAGAYRLAFRITGLGWKAVAMIADITTALILILFGILVLARAVHGRELSWSPMECQINTHSTPDAVGLSKIVTLVSRRYVKSLRHGIYDHEDCAKAISDWVRSQLCALPVR